MRLPSPLHCPHSRREYCHSNAVVGGVTNGYDLLVGYARSGKYFHPSLVEIGIGITEAGDRGQYYDVSTVKYFTGFGWHIVRAWFAGWWWVGESKSVKQS